MPIPLAKRCTSCGEKLPLSAFNHATKARDGRAPTCRRCASRARRPRKEPTDRSLIRAAIKHGDYKTLRTLFSRSPFSVQQLLSMTVQDYNTAAKHAGHETIVDFLVSKGGTPHWSLLFELARGGNTGMIQRLMAAGVELNIFACAAIGDRVRLKKLLRQDANLAHSKTTMATRSFRDFTPLHFCSLSAISRRSRVKARQLLDVARMLVDHEADVNASGLFYGSLPVSPLDMAAHSGGNIALIEYLIDNRAVISMFAFGEALAHRGRSLDEGIALAELFLRRGFKINSPHEDGTILHRAANTGAAEVVRWLLAHGADVNARGRMGRTPLHLAAERNRSPHVVQILLDHGARLDARDDSGMTPLNVAKEHRKTSLERWLGSI